jgi:hypothetical protein
MEDEVFSAEGEGALDFAAEGRDGFLADDIRLAAEVDEVAGVDDEGGAVELGAEGAHLFAMGGLELGGTPHAGAGGEDLKGVGADLMRALGGAKDASGGGQMDADAGGGHSASPVYGEQDAGRCSIQSGRQTSIRKGRHGMILGISLALFTKVHVVISLIAICVGFVVAAGMIGGRMLSGLTAFFLVMTALTSGTGFLFPYKGVTPGIVFGVISMMALLLAGVARYGGNLVGTWRVTWVISAMVAQYLNFFVFLVQLFDKVPALHMMAHRQKETLFAAAQLATLVAFVLWTVMAVRRFRPEAA